MNSSQITHMRSFQIPRVRELSKCSDKEFSDCEVSGFSCESSHVFKMRGSKRPRIGSSQIAHMRISDSTSGELSD